MDNSVGYKVTLAEGATEVVEADHYRLYEGHLCFYAGRVSNETATVIYAPGAWRRFECTARAVIIPIGTPIPVKFSSPNGSWT